MLEIEVFNKQIQMGVINMTNEDYILLKDVKQLTNEELLKRINLYNELSTQDKIDIHKKCHVNLAHYLSRIGMDVNEIGKFLTLGAQIHAKFIVHERNINNSSN